MSNTNEDTSKDKDTTKNTKESIKEDTTKNTAESTKEDTTKNTAESTSKDTTKDTTKDTDMKILAAWETCWNSHKKGAGIFQETFCKAYEESRRKKTENKDSNRKWKKAFIIIVLLVAISDFIILYMFIFGKLKVLYVAYMGNVLIILGLVCGAVAKWIEIKKFQETWARHSKTIFLLKKEMLMFIGDLGPYDSIDKQEVFMMRVLAVWEKNENKFCENMEQKEKPLMDIFDRFKLKKM